MHEFWRLAELWQAPFGVWQSYGRRLLPPGRVMADAFWRLAELWQGVKRTGSDLERTWGAVNRQPPHPPAPAHSAAEPSHADCGI